MFRIRRLQGEELAQEICINGVNIFSLQDEELDNMQTISQLMLLWFELTFGVITIPHQLLSRSTAQESKPTSLIWELDSISGNVSALENFKRSRE